MDNPAKVMARITDLSTNVNPYRNQISNLFSPTDTVQEEALDLICQRPENELHVTKNGSDFGKTLSIRCIVEFVPNVQYVNGSRANVPNGYASTEVDQHVKIPVHTAFYEVVTVVLQMFGYPKEAAVTAKGSIEIENWRPIKVEKVALNHFKTVDEILGGIRRDVTLRIQILKTSSNYVRLTRLKDQLLQWFVLQFGERMQSMGCPLDHSTFGSILCGTIHPTEEEISRFDQWMTNQLRPSLRANIPSSRSLAQYPLSNLPSPIASSNMHQDDRVHPTHQTVHKPQAMPHRTRTSFDQELEIPLLQRWFSENPNPTLEQKQEYVNKLNSLKSRKGKKKLAVHNITYWFKNNRAALKKEKGREINSSQMNSPSRYESNSHSPCDLAGTSRESVESYDEDDTNDEGNRSNKMEEDEKEDNSDQRPSSLSARKNENDDSGKNSSLEPEIKLELPGDKRRQVVTAAGSSSEPLSSPDQLGYYSDTDTINGYGSDDDEDEQLERNGYSTTKSNSEYYSSPHSLIPGLGNNPIYSLVPPNPAMFNHTNLIRSIFPNISFNAAAAAAVAAATAPNLVQTSSRSSKCGGENSAASSPSDDQKRAAKRNRTFIDPTTEVPLLEEWFRKVTHPSISQVLQFTEKLNGMPYRQKFPKLEPKNVQFWFKNRRAKDKRLKVSLHDPLNNNISSPDSYNQLAILSSSINKYKNHNLSTISL